MNAPCGRPWRVAVVATHPIQYYRALYRALAARPEVDLEVLFAHRQDAAGQAKAGFGVAFEWDVPLLDGYFYRFLENRARRPDASSFFGCHTPGVKAVIRASRYDAVVVHGWYSRSYIQAIRTCWASGTPVLVRGDSQLATPRGRWRLLLKKPLYRWLIPRFDGYLVVGERAREYYRHYGADPRKMYVSPHCVDNDFFAAHAVALAPWRVELRARWEIPDGSVCCLFAGKLIARKRPFDFVRSVGMAAAAGDRVHGLVVGDGPLRSSLQEYAREEKVPVSFAGFLNQTEMPQAYVAADVLVLPSDGHETWGLVVNEAMASGLPAAVSDAAGCAPDLVMPGRTGFVFPCGDIRALSEVIGSLAGTAAGATEMGQAAREHVARFSAERAAAGVVEGVEAACRGRVGAMRDE